MILMIVGANWFGGFIHCILMKLYVLLIAFSLNELVELIEIAFLFKFGN